MLGEGEIDYELPALFLVESRTKCDLFMREACRAGFTLPRVLATAGRLADLPESIDMPEFRADGRIDWQPLRPELVALIRNALSEPGVQLFLCLDDDIEGEVIAYQALDLAEGLPGRDRWWRVRPHDLTQAGFLRALSLAEWKALDISRLREGIGRRLVDRRLAKQALSVAETQGRPDRIGRVYTPALGSIRDNPLPVTMVSRHLGDGWFVLADAAMDEEHALHVADLIREAPADIEELTEGSLRQAERQIRPDNGSMALLRFCDRFELTPAEVAQTLQRLYENQELGYPRTSSQILTYESAAELDRLARHWGESGFDPQHLCGEQDDGGGAAGEAHQALRPLISEIPKPGTAEFETAGLSQQMLGALGERLIAAGTGQRERVEWSPVRADQAMRINRAAGCEISPRLIRITWHDSFSFRPRILHPLTGNPLAPGEKWGNDTKVVGRCIETQIFRRLLGLRIGTPATLTGHASKLARGSITKSGRLSQVAQREVAIASRVLPELLSPRSATTLHFSLKAGTFRDSRLWERLESISGQYESSSGLSSCLRQLASDLKVLGKSNGAQSDGRKAVSSSLFHL